MIEYCLRQAEQTDAFKIRSLVHRARINPTALNWRRFVIAETDVGEFIGCGQLKPHADGSLELASIAVEEPYRGQGVAHGIIEYLLAHSPRPLFLMCRAELGSFYARFGFKVVGLEPLPPYFQRIRWVFRLVKSLFHQENGLIMRLD